MKLIYNNKDKMGIFSGLFKKESNVEEYSPTIGYDEVNSAMNNAKIVEEKFKGEVENRKIKFPVELGEEHPFDFVMCEELNKKEGFVNAVIDKYVDYIVGPGFYVECEDERAKKIIEDFNRETNMDTQLRSWIRQALAKGNSDLELGGGKNEAIQGMKLLNSNNVYIDRDDYGELLGYKQYTGAFKKFDKKKVVDFKPHEIAHLSLNKIGDSAYGYGIIYPALVTVNNMLRSEKDLHMLMSRKANSPYHIKMGGVFGGKYYKPVASDVTKIGKELEYQTNKLDWTTDGLTEIKVIDFGNIGDKFDAVLRYDQEKLFYIFQIPAVIMGMANVSEGLAKVQMDAFERRIQSIQAEVEKIIEGQIYKRILNSNNLDFHVEFQWGQPSQAQNMERLTKLQSFMSNMRTSETLFKLMEKDVVKLLGYDEDEYEVMSEEEERKREEERPLPIVPGQNEKKPQPVLPGKPIPKKESINEERWVTYKGRKLNIGDGGGGGGGGVRKGDKNHKSTADNINNDKDGSYLEKNFKTQSNATNDEDKQINNFSDNFTKKVTSENKRYDVTGFGKKGDNMQIGEYDVTIVQNPKLYKNNLLVSDKEGNIYIGEYKLGKTYKTATKPGATQRDVRFTKTDDNFYTRFFSFLKKKESYETGCSCGHCQESWENINDIQEWLGFNYKEYLLSISAIIKVDNFINLRAENDIEEQAGYLSQIQINELKRVMNNGFTKGKGIREIARDIETKVNPHDLYDITDNNEIGNKIKNGIDRSIMIARTEVTRLANRGAMKQFADNGISKVRWVASMGDRTCPTCEGLNGQIVNINESFSGDGFTGTEPPAHVMCRCTVIPVTELG